MGKTAKIKKLTAFGLLFLILMVSLSLQSTLFNSIPILNVKPDLVVIAVIFVGLLYGPETGASFGFLSGLFQGILAGNYLFSFLMSKTLLGFLAGCLKGTVFYEKLTVIIPLIFFGTLAEIFVFALLSGQISNAYWLKIVALEPLYNALLSLILLSYPLSRLKARG